MRTDKKNFILLVFWKNLFCPWSQKKKVEYFRNKVVWAIKKLITFPEQAAHFVLSVTICREPPPQLWKQNNQNKTSNCQASRKGQRLLASHITSNLLSNNEKSKGRNRIITTGNCNALRYYMWMLRAAEKVQYGFFLVKKKNESAIVVPLYFHCLGNCCTMRLILSVT